MAAAHASRSSPWTDGHGVEVQVEKSGAAQDMFDLRAAVLGAQHPEQIDLPVGPRCVIRVPALRRDWPEPSVHTMQIGLTQSGASGDDDSIAVGMGRAVLQDDNLVAREQLRADGHRFEIVEQGDACGSDTGGDVARGDVPRDVRQAGALIDHRPGSPDRDRVDREAAPGFACERLQHLGEAVERGRRVRLDGDGTRTWR
jgi:hypothetical protein